jgi:predicted Zn-dependent peptidase
MNWMILGLVLAAQTEGWRAQPPPVPPAQPPVLPSFQRSTLDNGLQVYSARTFELPIASFTLVTRGGSAADPQGQAGLTALMVDVMQEGAGTLDALAFSDRVADFGASFGGGVGRDSSSLGISGLSRHAEDLMELLQMAVRNPRLDADAFSRRRDERRATLTRRRGSPQGIAFDAFAGLLYGPDHPYGHPPGGTLETLDGLTLQDVQTQHDRLVQPSTSALVVAGNLRHADVVRLAEAKFGDWRGTGAPLRIPAVEARARERIVVIDKPQAPQTMVVLGRPLPAKGHPDEVAISLLNEVYGGSFASRINLNLREDKGYTYGAGSQAAFRRGVGAFVAYGAIRSDVTGAALSEFMAELRGLSDRPATAPEVQRAKDGVVRALTGRFERASSVAGAATQLFLYDLPLDYFEGLGPRFSTESLDRVREARRPYFDPETMQVLLVGDADFILPQLELAGFTSIERRKP